MKLKKLALASLVSGALCLIGAPAQAALILNLSDGGANTVTLTDNDADGRIVFAGALGIWNVNLSMAVGTAAYANGFGMDLFSFNSSTGAGTLHVAMTETDLNWGTPGMTPAHLGGGIGGTSPTTAGTSVSYGMYTDNGNVAFGKGTTVFTGTGSGLPFSGSGGADVNLADPFSMSLFVDITHAAKGNTSFDFEGKVPEPASLALLGLGLLGVGFSRRRNVA